MQGCLFRCYGPQNRKKLQKQGSLSAVQTRIPCMRVAQPINDASATSQGEGFVELCSCTVQYSHTAYRLFQDKGGPRCSNKKSPEARVDEFVLEDALDLFEDKLFNLTHILEHLFSTFRFAHFAFDPDVFK